MKKGVRKPVRRKKRKVSSVRREVNAGRIAAILAAVLTLGLLVVVGVFISKNHVFAEPDGSETETSEAPVPSSTAVMISTEDIEAEEQAKQEALDRLKRRVHAFEPEFEFAEFSGEPTYRRTGDPVLDRANLLAAGYSYDEAIALIKSVEGYEEIPEYMNVLASCKAWKTSVAPWVVKNNVTHIFFHSLIVNPALAFNKRVAGFKVEDYNQAMTTVSEFVKMIEELYDEGYVLVDIYDVAKMVPQEDGTMKMTAGTLYLPEGKKPLILSIDDTNYYEYMEGQGFATKLIVDENGRVQNTYTLLDGTEVTGSFDVIPILEDFLEIHPDFSYHGARGILGVTGYNGVLGYRTCDFWYNDDCPYYEPTEENNTYKAQEVGANNPNIEADKVTAREVADAIKAMNWHFASHTWGHKRLGTVAMETMTWDSDMWKREVEPIVGPTDLLIFPYGNDFGQAVAWKEYEYQGENARYRTMKSYGFNYFMNVDSAVYFVQRTDDYFREGRRNLDGDRLWEAYYADRGIGEFKNRISDLFKDVSKIIDPLRPELDKYLKKIQKE